MTFSRVESVPVAGSTNSELMASLDIEAWPHLSVLVADSQVAGRGRSGNEWVTAPGSALTCSVVLLPEMFPQIPFTWIPLVGGLAVRRALMPWIVTKLKWPNDIVADSLSPDPAWGWGPKIGGILCEIHASGAVVVGIGVNCLRSHAPVPWAASIQSLVEESPTPRELLPMVGDALAAVLSEPVTELRSEYSDVSAVLGAEVSIVLPGGASLVGRAIGIDDDGALKVQSSKGVTRVTTGDARRVRGTNCM